jgi:hypothetical protein
MTDGELKIVTALLLLGVAVTGLAFLTLVLGFW